MATNGKGKLKLSKASREALGDLLGSLLTPQVASKGVRKTDVGKSKLESWIAATAKKNPARAAELALALAEYSAPKLARVEQTGEDGGPLRVIVKTSGGPQVPVKSTPQEE